MENDETIASGDPPAPPVDKPGSRIGKYELLRPLGAGGMGVVWAARDPDLDREVAIKLLRSANAGPEQRTRLLREARAMARLKHPNVLTVYEVDTDGTRDFIAMELVDGTNLDTWLHTKPPAREVWDALLAAGRGLAAAHDAGLVHRDFKPHNVLRSRDGRVLVTDFGLARGQADEPALAATLDPGTSAGDSILDVKLTTTGQLLGTPAYMASEQFAGETPDPRTDQFAFCVTAWEALTGGERPYAGTTIDELRTATAEGRVVEGSLPAGVRRVLVRGLAVKRAARWPDMRVLLAALERARHTTRRRALVAVPLLAVGAAAAAFALRTPASAPAKDACEPGEQVFATAWSPTIRTDVLHAQPTATQLASLLDAYRGRWLTGYAKACTRPPAQRLAAVNCYYSKRDEVAVLVELVQRIAPQSLAGIDDWGVLSSGDTCAGDDPISSPRIPDDNRRPKVITFLAKLYGNILVAPTNVLAQEPQIRDEAKAIGWGPLEAKVEEAVAIADQDGGKAEVASRAYRKAADLSRGERDYLTEARARLGVLEISMDNIVEDMPRTAFEQELRDATIAIRNAGNDPALVATLDVSRAIHAAYAAEELSRAIQILDGAHATFMKLQDRQRAPHSAAKLAEYLSLRAAPGDLDRAANVLADAQKLAGSPLAPRVAREMRGMTYWIAWLRGDLAAAHAALDANANIVQVAGTRITGRVVNEVGVGVPGAHVIEWTGELFGDATRAFTDRGFAPLHDAVTDASGAFEIQASDGDGLIAELDDRRSQPVPARDGAQLALRPTHAITGTVDVGGDPAIGLEPFVRFVVTPTSSWAVSTAPAADGHFQIAGLPDAPARLGAIGSHWPREIGRRLDAGPATDHAVIHWPTGITADIQTHAKSGTVWEFHAAVKAKTRAEVERLAATASDVATVQITPIGWGNTTSAGIASYEAAERHAVVRDNGPGPQTVCAALDGRPTVECRTYNEAPDPGVVRDGRHWFPSSTSLFLVPESGSQQRPLSGVLRSDP